MLWSRIKNTNKYEENKRIVKLYVQKAWKGDTYYVLYVSPNNNFN